MTDFLEQLANAKILTYKDTDEHFWFTWKPTNRKGKYKGRIKGISLWRQKVIDKAERRCIICGSTLHLEAHHIEAYHKDECLRLDVDNGVCLCNNCHRGPGGFHRLFGTRNNNEEQWREFYSMKR